MVSTSAPVKDDVRHEPDDEADHGDDEGDRAPGPRALVRADPAPHVLAQRVLGLAVDVGDALQDGEAQREEREPPSSDAAPRPRLGRRYDRSLVCHGVRVDIGDRWLLD
jgi:hypothetical protein